MTSLNPFKAKTFERFGDHFVNQFKSIDLSSVVFVHSGVDTLKQLFGCNLRSDVLEQLEHHFQTFDTELIHINGYDFLLSKGSKKTGYQFILKNLEAGFVVLLKSFYVEADQNGSHLKIEVTPQKIFQSTPEQLTQELKQLAYVFATNVTEKGVAAHLCTDMVGFEVPEDFEYRLQTSARRNFKVNGVSHADFSLSDVSVIYGSTETYTFGQSNAVQMCLYNKTEEARKGDKLHFWEPIWSSVMTGFDEGELKPAYVEGNTVRRLEFRFHHSVIEDFERFVQTRNPEAQIRNYEQLQQHLSGLWRYALNNFRLMDDKGYVDPLWQALADDVVFFHSSPDFIYKRQYKKPSSEVNHRHIAHTLGNYIKVCARRNYTPAFVTNKILQFDIEADLCSYFGLLQFGESEHLPSVLGAFVQQRMMQHRLNGVGR
jgi:hypothetical protein